MKKFILPLLIVLCVGTFSIREYKEYQQVQFNSTENMVQDLVEPIIRIKGKNWFGSGVLVYTKQNEQGTWDSIVLTNNHCIQIAPGVYGVEYIEIFRKGSSVKVPGIVLQQSPNNEFGEGIDNPIITKAPAGQDLALVLINTDFAPSVARMPTKDLSLKLFEKIRVVGCSLGGMPRMTDGEITILDTEYMSVNALFAPGNSGGALYLDRTHELIGITNAGINGYNWMGMCRDVKNTYKWLDKVGYSFIYDHQKSNKQIEKDLLRVEIDRKISDLLDKISIISGENSVLKQQVETLLKEIDLLKKQLENKEKHNVEETGSQSSPSCPRD